MVHIIQGIVQAHPEVEKQDEEIPASNILVSACHCIILLYLSFLLELAPIGFVQASLQSPLFSFAGIGNIATGSCIPLEHVR